MKLLKTLVAASAAFGVVATAQAGVTASGHVAYQVQSQDSADDLVIRRNGFTQSRFRFNASKKVGANKWGIQQEFGLGDDDSSPIVRRNNFYVSGGFGKVSLGMGNDVGDGAINADLAGTNIVGALSSNSAVTGIGVNGSDPDRGEALRYYSPKLGGVAKVAAQLKDAGDTEIVLKVDTNGFRFNAFVEDGDSVDKSGFLVGYKFSGFSVTYVSSDDAAEADEHTGFKVGYATGKHKVSFMSVEQGAAEASGLQYLYNAAKGVQLYAGTQDVDGGDSATFFGGRVKF